MELVEEVELLVVPVELADNEVGRVKIGTLIIFGSVTMVKWRGDKATGIELTELFALLPVERVTA